MEQHPELTTAKTFLPSVLLRCSREHGATSHCNQKCNIRSYPPVFIPERNISRETFKFIHCNPGSRSVLLIRTFSSCTFYVFNRGFRRNSDKTTPNVTAFSRLSLWHHLGFCFQFLQCNQQVREPPPNFPLDNVSGSIGLRAARPDLAMVGQWNT